MLLQFKTNWLDEQHNVAFSWSSDNLHHFSLKKTPVFPTPSLSKCIHLFSLLMELSALQVFAITDVSGQPIRPIFKGHATSTLEDEGGDDNDDFSSIPRLLTCYLIAKGQLRNRHKIYKINRMYKTHLLNLLQCQRFSQYVSQVCHNNSVINDKIQMYSKFSCFVHATCHFRSIRHKS